jgi:hypothetical protein
MKSIRRGLPRPLTRVVLIIGRGMMRSRWGLPFPPWQMQSQRGDGGGEGRRRRWRRRWQATMKFIPHLPSQLQLEMCLWRQSACHLAGAGSGGIGVIHKWFIEPPPSLPTPARAVQATPKRSSLPIILSWILWEFTFQIFQMFSFFG